MSPRRDDGEGEDRYLFYRLDPPADIAGPAALPVACDWRLWRPSPFRVVPLGFPLLPYGPFWWMMHLLGIFSNRDFGMLLIYQGETLVHHTVIFPGYLRFPFMAIDDLNLGEVWTHPSLRGKGLADFGLRKAVQLLRRAERRFWYIHRAGNEPSARVAAKAGFPRVGSGVKVKRLGLNSLAYLRFDPPT